ncbi:response regulator [Rhizobium alvei]|uniref:Response regulator n=1 Tax=Rhizobium alvei TaxID=1132659 RepID=A0ABT8YGP1_9HYPH|nr:response regulator [Rhizobium alvei]MDO6962816.1 response regulator [Rhizobium alvei]
MGQLILVIEDEKEIRRFLEISLGDHGHTVLQAADAASGRRLIVDRKPDLVILDLGLPDQDGQDFIRDLREWSEVPVIVLSARDAEAQKVEALENGADDYLTKPFSVAELAARIKVALRRRPDTGSPPVSSFVLDDLSIDYAARRVTLAGEEVRLTPIEYKLLIALTRHAGKVLTHGQLMKDVWGRRAVESHQSLRIHTQHLREKLKDDPLAPRFIITEPGIGYRFRSGG